MSLAIFIYCTIAYFIGTIDYKLVSLLPYLGGAPALRLLGRETWLKRIENCSKSGIYSSVYILWQQREEKGM